MDLTTAFFSTFLMAELHSSKGWCIDTAPQPPPSKSTKRILFYLIKNGHYTLPQRFHVSEDGSIIPISVVFWKSDLGGGLCEFGITVTTRGDLEHTMFNVKTAPVHLDEPFILLQLDRVKRILTRPFQALCGTLGPHKSAMMHAVGMDKKTLGIEECCVCARETATKIRSCDHNICIACLSKVDRCPLCRNSEIACACCDSDEECNESDDEFADV